ncbi:MAG TPA: imidazoleglycerol-phosphate dehydratase HisB [Candidatus Nitrosocosmicus sp.]|nr:imidazoleglycerol-phosphate dehydratase HisB [Candidatus Nitrosocosmicus sp.]
MDRIVKERIAILERRTKETSINLNINLDGKGKSDLKTNIPFLDHLLNSFARFSNIDIQLIAKSEDMIKHHLIEDIGIVMGKAINIALGNREKIERFGYSLIPMDESLSKVAIDLIIRPYCYMDLKLERESIEDISKEDIIHFVQSFVSNINCCTHIIVEYGANDHHKIEATIKAFAIALKNAMKMDSSIEDKPSTKGMM